MEYLLNPPFPFETRRIGSLNLGLEFGNDVGEMKGKGIQYSIISIYV